MLDIHDFLAEKGGDPEAIKKSEKKRGKSGEIVDLIVALYKEWTIERFNLDAFNRELNAVQRDISAKIKEDIAPLLVRKRDIEERRRGAEALEAEKLGVLRQNLNTVGNIVHDSVPVSRNEEDNEVLRTWEPQGTVEKKDCLSHHELLLRLDGYDPERGVKVVGHRGYFLRNYGVLLSQALITLQDGNDEKYLIATSEQPISAFHSGEWFENPSEQLPIRYAGISSCYRRESGAHGKDTWGIFRVHQFEKVEQFLITSPESSWALFEEMISIAEEFYKSLSIPYRIVSIVSGALNNAASKKYDLEAWFPFQGEYKELVSCSNCTDYQSRNLEIRCGTKRSGDKEKKYVHCLNSTLCAVTRTLCCILENFQTSDGINIPEPLQAYMGGKTFIPFVKDLSSNKMCQKDKMQELVIVTGNIKKFEEIKEIFGSTVKLTRISLDLPEIQGEIHEIVLDKCKKAVDIVKKPVIVEDTCLFFTSFNGLPGPYIKWFLSSLGLDVTDNAQGLVRLLEAFPDKTAEAVCLFAYCKGPGDSVHIFEGRTLGSIVPARGPTVFGWDAIFQPLGCDQTYAEMGQTLKHTLSHRSKALTKLIAFLKHANNDV
ncbi:hypothetical protein MERGE_001142 [Pneumocystis wakefieldiae]|uniref:Inosine triphosphate pyrophosphatase n=1 Tax=Pneumocystis wakefieldiae TaxID=38082 RepID=A0A899G1J8_9ASCO|nr:hypothetical protein MERGE_001142 [Pneumocystis wakefieldiae]